MELELFDISTPALLVEKAQLEQNIHSMQSRVDSFGPLLRPHVKTAKCLEIANLQKSVGARGLTVSTLKEAEFFFDAGFNDILYAVSICPQKLKKVHELLNRGCDLRIITDNIETAIKIRNYGELHNIYLNVLIEIDTDDHRAGVKPDSPILLDIARELTSDVRGGAHLLGVMTHAGGSYECTTTDSLIRFAEKERSGCVLAAERLRSDGNSCPIVSIGSTPTVLSSLDFTGVTEVRVGVYVFHDLVMNHIGVCSIPQIALSVLTTVIGHQPEKNWILIDAGWMAMSRDFGIKSSSYGFGYGLVLPFDNSSSDSLQFVSTNQEHGIIVYKPSPHEVSSVNLIEKYPIGTMFRILPNHACATASQYSEYHLIEKKHESDSHPKGEWVVTDIWKRFNGW
jgi:D-serine deaminase-like pyridoxal phosphate-dependent protein